LKAVSLLRNPREKVINVAEQCGFNHLGLFNTCFKKRYGTSPGQWRKLALGTEAQPGGRKTEGKTTCPLHANGLCPWGGQPDAFNIVAKGQVSTKGAEVAGSLAAANRKEVLAKASSPANGHQPALGAQPGNAA
jgi:hypothetical protein